MTTQPLTVQGAIYDIDDTLLNNQPHDDNPLSNLHQQARLIAIHEIARRHNFPALLGVEAQENYDAFARAETHTVAGAFWVILKDYGIKDGSLNAKDPLILEMIEIKNEAYGALLEEHGRAHVGAVEFVKDFSENFDLHKHNAIASTAARQDIHRFLQMTNLDELIPDTHIISVESVENHKPHPEAFDKAFLSLGLSEDARKNVYAFEDDPRGMLSARQAGLTVCAITTRYSREELMQIEAKPDYIADSFAEFRVIFGLPPLPE